MFVNLVEDNLVKTDCEIKRAAQLSLAEISIGAIGHGFKIPLTGQVLSLNQLGFLLTAINKDQLPVRSVFEISSIAAVLKSFSPAGQKLGPMLSITMQGFLFWLGCVMIRFGILGQIIGAILLASWSFFQPVVTYFIIYGVDLVKVIEYYNQKMNQDFSFFKNSILFAFVGIFILKQIFAIGLVIYSWITKKEIQLMQNFNIHSKVTNQFQTNNTNAFKAALRDLTKPLFLFSFVLMVIFVWQIETSFSQKIWLSLRPLASAYIIFYLLRSSWVSQKLFKLSQKSKRFNTIYQKALKTIQLLSNKKL